MARKKSADIERNSEAAGESLESQTPRRDVPWTWSSPVVVILQRRNLRFRISRHGAIRRIQRLGDIVVQSNGVVCEPEVLAPCSTNCEHYQCTHAKHEKIAAGP